MTRSPTGCSSMRARRARPRGRAGSAESFDWRLLEELASRRAVHAVGRARPRQCRRGACGSRARPASTSPPASSARRARRTPTRSAPSSAPRAGRRCRPAARKSRAAHDRPAAAQFLPHRARRARPFRHLWRPLRRRDADAAHPRSGKGLCGGQGRSGVQAGDGRPSHPLCRPAVAALFRRAPDRASSRISPPGRRRREDLLQARGPQSHRRAQGEQRARPDHAGAPHGQAARDRRDRRRHAWRRDRDDVREVRPEVHRLHGLGRRRAAEAERAAHEGARRRGACR